MNVFVAYKSNAACSVRLTTRFLREFLYHTVPATGTVGPIPVTPLSHSASVGLCRTASLEPHYTGTVLHAPDCTAECSTPKSCCCLQMMTCR